jgi:hypothetical protein
MRCLFCFLLWGETVSPLGTSATIVGLYYQPRMIDDQCGAVGGMRIGRGDRSTRRKPAPVLLCPPQIIHDLNWARTRAAAVGSRRPTAWAMARPKCRDSENYFMTEFLNIFCSTQTHVSCNLKNIVGIECGTPNWESSHASNNILRFIYVRMVGCYFRIGSDRFFSKPFYATICHPS